MKNESDQEMNVTFNRKKRGACSDLVKRVPLKTK